MSDTEKGAVIERYIKAIDCEAKTITFTEPLPPELKPGDLIHTGSGFIEGARVAIWVKP